MSMSMGAVYSELAAKGMPAHVSEVHGSAKELYRVRLAPVADRGAAGTELARVKSLGFPGAVIPNAP